MTSTYLKAILLIVLLTLFNACEEETLPSSNCDFFVELDANKYENGASSFYQIISAEINDYCLEIKYSSSGCSGESWTEEMVDAEAILESFPIQRNFKMLLENNEVCAAVFTKTVSFDLTPIQIEGYSKIIINIHGLENSLLYQYDVDTSIEMKIQDKWNLVNINGGLMGIDEKFNEGEISWRFNEDKVIIENNSSDMNKTGSFESGTYSYQLAKPSGDSNWRLEIDEINLGTIILLSSDSLIIDQRASDGFQYVLVK